MFNNRIVTSLKDITNIANEYYISKIDSIRKMFKPSKVSHIDLLKKLIPKPNVKMKIPLITIDKTKLLIKK